MPVIREVQTQVSKEVIRGVMKVLYITAWDSFGIQFNGYILGKALRQAGIDTNMLVAKKAFSDPEIQQVHSPILSKVDSVLIRIENRLSLQRLLPISFGSIFSHKWYQEADIVHLQLPHATPFLNLQMVRRISREKKLVWTVHDPWLATGHCVYFMDCERWKHGCGHCPDLSLNFPIRRDTTSFNWRVKKKLLENCDIHLIVASQWMHDIVKASPILCNFPAALIPFGVDTQVFRPLDKIASREKFNIPEDAHVLACRWVGYNPVKGVKYIEEALSQLAVDRPIYIITFDSGNQGKYQREGVHFVELGWVTDQSVVVDALNAADIFLMPSTAEAFGLMAIEAMACGLPVIVFEGTALPSVVHAPRGGLAVSRNSTDLARAIKDLLEHPEFHAKMSQEALEIVTTDYTLGQYVSRHEKLYRDLLAGG